jgi:hypothetical protein
MRKARRVLLTGLAITALALAIRCWQHCNPPEEDCTDCIEIHEYPIRGRT